MSGLHPMYGKSHMRLVSEVLPRGKELDTAEKVVQAPNDTLRWCSMNPRVEGIDASS